MSHSDAVPEIYLQMLKDYRRYAETLWHEPQPSLGYWGSGRAQGGDDVRDLANTALAYAVLAYAGDDTFKIEDRVGPALRYAAEIYHGGPLHGSDGKQWGNSWQSAMFAGTLGLTAWVARDHLDAPTLSAVERVVSTEADRFIGANPPDRAPGDTKAEENAWDLTAPAAALMLMPRHPHAAGWREAVIRYGLNTLSVSADRRSDRVVDGKPLRDRVTTTQLYPDFTLENHAFFHPTYMMVAPGLEATAAMDLKLAGEPIPEALKHNVLKQWKTLQYITLADGDWLYPQGMDWDLNSFEQLLYWAMMSAMYKDPAAALMEQRAAEQLRRRQNLNGDGRFVGSLSTLGFGREAAQVERIAVPYLMHAAFGSRPAGAEADWRRMVRSLKPVRAFRYVGFVVHRFPRGLVSFSWKNHLMGLAYPEYETHLDSPYLTTPEVGSLVGSVTVVGQSPQEARKFSVLRVAIDTSKDGFMAALDVEINDGLLRQQIAVASCAPGVLAYIDRVTAQKDVQVSESRGLPIAVENDYLNGNRRLIASAGGEWTAMGGEEGDHSLLGNWLNVDGRLGLISVFGGGLVYRSAGEKPNRPGARYDLMIGSYTHDLRSFGPGEIVAERAGLLLLDSPAAETAATAAATQANHADHVITLNFISDGHSHSLRLGEDGTAEWDGHPVTPRRPRNN